MTTHCHTCLQRLPKEHRLLGGRLVLRCREINEESGWSYAIGEFDYGSSYRLTLARTVRDGGDYRRKAIFKIINRRVMNREMAADWFRVGRNYLREWDGT